MSKIDCKNCIVHWGYDPETKETCCGCVAGEVTLCHEHTTEDPTECYCLECQKLGRNFYAHDPIININSVAKDLDLNPEIVGFVYLTQNQILGE